MTRNKQNFHIFAMCGEVVKAYDRDNCRVRRLNTVYKLMLPSAGLVQCCESGPIFFGAGSTDPVLKIRIRIRILLKYVFMFSNKIFFYGIYLPTVNTTRYGSMVDHGSCCSTSIVDMGLW